MTLSRNSTEEQNSEKIQSLWGQLPLRKHACVRAPMGWVAHCSSRRAPVRPGI